MLIVDVSILVIATDMWVGKSEEASYSVGIFRRREDIYADIKKWVLESKVM